MFIYVLLFTFSMVKNTKSNKNNLTKNSEVKLKVRKINQDDDDVKILNENKKTKKKDSDEPSWYHYLIVLVVIGLIVFGIVGLSNLNKSGKNEITQVDNSTGEKVIFHKYKYEYNGKTINIAFRNTEEVLYDFQLNSEVDLKDILNSQHLNMMFYEYNGTDNGYVGIGSGFLTSFLTVVHNMHFDKIETVDKENFTCNNSTPENKYLLFDPYSDREGIFYDLETGCVKFETYDAKRMILLTEKLVYDNVVEN